MSRILACLPRAELPAGTAYLSQRFESASIVLHQAGFDAQHSATPQILLFVEEEFSQNDNVLRLILCRDFHYLFFSKTTNPHWSTNCGPGRLVDESEQFILWQVM